MRAEDLDVRQQLIEAGYGGRAIECRGDMYEILVQILAEDPASNDDFVDRLRTILSEADHQERRMELERVRAEHQGVRACPYCGQRPDVGYLVDSTDEIFVSCMNHQGEAIARGAATLGAAIEKWNRDDWFSRPGTRSLYPL